MSDYPCACIGGDPCPCRRAAWDRGEPWERDEEAYRMIATPILDDFQRPDEAPLSQEGAWSDLPGVWLGGPPTMTLHRTPWWRTKWYRLAWIVRRARRVLRVMGRRRLRMLVR